MKIIELQQGTPEWHAHRANHFNASDAPAMMGVSPYKTRSQLLKEYATGLVPEVDASTQRRFDDGHRFEALARPLAETIIGQDLYPVTGCMEEYSASFDGLTMDERIAFEHKSINEDIRACSTSEELPVYYRIQMEQQLMIAGADKCLFMATQWDGDDNLIDKREFWYMPDKELRHQIGLGWIQFKKDLANYQHVEVIPAAVAAPIKDLPALNIQISGSVVASNLADWKDVVIARIDEINTDLKTDTDFATAESTVKFLDEGEKKIDLVKAQAQSQASDIDQVFRAMDEIKAMMKQKRLELDKLVKSRKEQVRMEVMQDAQAKLSEHVKTLNERIGWYDGCQIMSPAAADFATAIKGKKSISSLRDACDTELARAKIATSEIADRIEINKKVMEQLCDPAIIFPDFAQVCTKDTKDFANLVAVRVGQHKEAEDKRLAAERERIRIEEERKANAKAREESMPKISETIDHGNGVKTIIIPNTPPEGPVNASTEDGIEATPAPGQRETSDDGKLVSVSDINRALGFTVTSDFLSSLGFTATHIKAAKLYKASEYGSICAAIVKHIKTTSVTQLRKAA